MEDSTQPVKIPMTTKQIVMSLVWAMMIPMGLLLVFNENYVSSKIKRWTEPPRVVALSAPPPPEVAMAMRMPPKPGEKVTAPEYTGGTTVQDPTPPPPATTAAGAPAKDWSDYMDKIVGWIVALAGAYKLIQKNPTPEEAPVAERKPRFTRKKK